MSSYKKLYLPFAIMVFLLVSLVVWLVVRKDDEPVVPEQTVTFLDIGSDNVASVQVTSADGSTLVVNAVSDADPDIRWSLLGFEDSDLDQDKLNDFVYHLSTLDSISVISDPASDAEYGFDTPDFTLTVTDKEGIASTVLIGDKTRDLNGCYVRLQGEQTVYTIPAFKWDCCSYTYLDFLVSRIMNISYSDVSSVSFERSGDGSYASADCYIGQNGGPDFVFTDPYDIKASVYFEDLIDSLIEMDAVTYFDIAEGEEADYGLDEPAYRFVFHMKHSDDVVIELSAVNDGLLYGSCSLCDHEFSVYYSSIHNLDTSLKDLMSYYVAYYAAYEVSSINCTCADRSFRMEIETDGAITDEDATVTVDGRNCNVNTSEGRSYTAILFESIVCMEIGGFEPEADPELTDPYMNVRIVTRSHDTVNIDFIPRGTDSYYVFINDDYAGYYLYSTELFADGGDNTYAYGVWSAYDLLNNAIMNSINGIYDIPGTENDSEGAA